eukprot:TRINITY_DN7971_c0_g1_i1.p1 TRINITY_DN7971_c0_g1~~TRINITY_DN7971_c0_g1_i1.p1  ORF type:complete len:445 (+),score=91.23 TRINITY_DN7971_c0_g1_i1:25-1335(+)
MFKITLTLALVVLCCSAAVAQSNNCKGTPNAHPIWDTPPTLVKSVQNGKLYTSGPANNTIKIVHLFGSPYDKGVAQAQLLKDDIENLYSNFYKFIENEVQQYLKNLPKDLVDFITKFGVTAALELEALATGKFIPQHFIDEMKGLADGLGMAYGDVVRLHMFPEMIKAACSMFGAWGDATSGNPKPGLVQLRALDWGLTNPFRLHPLVAVYHPNATAQGNPYASLTWTGFIGSITGMGAETGVCEKVWLHSHSDPTSRFGIPWHFLMRDILEYDTTLAQAIDRVEKATRTCSIFLGVGSRQDGQFRIIEYSHKDAPVFNASSPFPGYAPTPAEHPLMKDLVYVDKHTQPSSDPCMASLLKGYYGKLGVPQAIDLVSRFQTGDLHIGVYDYANNAMYVSVASQDIPYPAPTNATIIPAHDRQFQKMDLTALFAVTNE